MPTLAYAAPWFRPTLVVLLSLGCFTSLGEAADVQVAGSHADDHQARPAKTIVELQPFRRSTTIRAKDSEGHVGTATLIELNPQVNAWYLLTLDFGNGRQATYHLENPAPQGQSLRLDDSYGYGVAIDAAGNRSTCDLWAGAPMVLEQARRVGLPYAPLCSGRLYLRNRVTGRATQLEETTDFLRDNVWGGEKIVGFVKREFFQDAFLERATTPSDAAPPAAEPALPGAPLPASLGSAYAAHRVLPQHLEIDLAGSTAGVLLGRWYRVNGLPAVYVSIVQPRAIASEILSSHSERVNKLDAVEAEALVYLVAFDLEAYDLGFAVGTVHPRVDWSARVLSDVRDSTPGPDGFGSVAPVVTDGMISPALAGRAVGTFTGGFKRGHGAFHYGVLARQDRGSHYGFIEQGTVLSRLIPGLSTLFVLDDGTVTMKTWAERDVGLLSRIKHARQNGVPLIEYDERTGLSSPGSLVAQWGPGNWSGSADENLRTLRAGACVQEDNGRRFLVYAYFSSATPSAMARVFQAYHCRYAMHLDMNALEHTYLALYVRSGNELRVEHLVEGMAAIDQKTGNGLVPRFLGVPDDRDFFYLTRRERPR